MTVTIVDYGLGNVQAVANIYKQLDVPVVFARDAAAVRDSTHLLLPGVGAFDWAMAKLQASGMREALDEMVQEHRRPVLGICVGMQMMARRSDEGQLPGLNWFDASVRRFDENRLKGATHLPHMGWNDVAPAHTDGLMAGLEQNARFYFLHSYHFVPNDPADTLATTDYGGPFACAVRRGHVHGVQFHPEKSHGWGVQLLKNFSEL